ncbi:MAG: PhoPQ-activated pathogenicity-related family protein [Planctomycetes bacterium]|nr:PhoPQ-activated pathogenicity-related family protein [Planctomycetota bacterium]
MRSFLILLTVLQMAAMSSLAVAKPPKTAARTPFDEYVQKPDAAYKWEIAKVTEGNPSKSVVIRLTSQSWRGENEVDRPVWEHWLVVVKPEKLKTNKGLLMVSGGKNDGSMPKRANEVLSRIADATGSIVAELRMVPNQPLVFHGDGQGRKEDNLIGYGLNQYLETGDPTWIPRLPMVKSVARAMDCLQEWSEQEGAKIEKFIVAGASKRGWTTWMIGAMDPRVAAIIPIVIDVVNVEPSMKHHAAVYGFWAKAIGDYYEHQILQRTHHPRMSDLYRIEDPYYYLDRLTMPKYIVNGSGDQFFCPDSSQFYFDDLKGEKHLRYVPNADHSVDSNFDAVTSIVTFYQMIIAGKPRPQMTWTFEDDGAIRVHSDTPPQQVLLWQANNPNARDFRLATIGGAYSSTELKPEADGSWVGRAATPDKGWTASFVELSYDTGSLFPFKVSSAVRVLPDTLPHKGIDPAKIEYEPNATRSSAAQ